MPSLSSVSLIKVVAWKAKDTGLNLTAPCEGVMGILSIVGAAQALQEFTLFQGLFVAGGRLLGHK